MPNIIIDTDTFFEKFGSEVIAPLLVAFIEWLDRTSKQDGVEKLLFMARDGYLPLKAYKRLVPSSGQLPTTYMYASRRLLNIPAIKQFDADTLNYLTADKPRMPVCDYMRRIGLEPELFTAEFRAVGFASAETTVSTRHDLKKVKRLLTHIEQAFLQSMQSERQVVLRYLNWLGFGDTGKRIAVVDIGWHGSMERSIQRLLGQDDAKHFYYFGLHTHVPAQPSRRAMLSESHNRKLYAQTVRRCVELFEISFAEPVGTIVGISEDKPGDFMPLHSEVMPDQDTSRAARSIQKGALSNLEAFRGISPESALEPIRRVLNNPTPQEAALLGDLFHNEGIADLGNSASLAKPKLSHRQYAAHPVQLFFDWHRSFWPKAFAVRYRNNT